MREAVVRRAEELAVGLAVIERGIVLAGHEADLFRAQAGDQLLELREAPAPLGTVVGGVREIAGEDDEVGLRIERVYRGDGFGQRARRVRVRRALEAPVRVRELHEEEFVRGARITIRAAGKPRCEYEPAQSCDLQELPPIDALHAGLPVVVVPDARLACAPVYSRLHGVILYLVQAASWRAMNAFTISCARVVCGPGSATHSCTEPAKSSYWQSPPAAR